MEMIIGSASHVGIKRSGKPNQDSMVVLRPQPPAATPTVLIVADGMGGYSGGEVASQTVIQQFINRYNQFNGKPFSMHEFAGACIQEAVAIMQQKAAVDPQLAAMGSTVVLVALEENQVQVSNVGDSRAYLINSDQIRQISHDHSFVAEALRAGLITPEQAVNHPKKNQLTQSISAMHFNLNPFYATEMIEKEDCILLCSDGLWGVVPEQLIQSIVLGNPPQKAADFLVQAANERGGPDNITVIIAKQTGESPITKPTIRVQRPEGGATLVQNR